MWAKLSALMQTYLWRLIAMVGIANLLVFALVGLSLEASYQEYRERASIVARNTNHLVSQSIASEIDRIIFALDATADEVARQQRAQGALDGPALEGFLARQQDHLPMLDSLRITDAAGIITHGAGGLPQSGVSVTDRDYFIALRDDPHRLLAISPPVQGRISGKWVLIFAHRLPDLPGNGFGGTVIASLSLDWFVNKLKELELGPHGVVMLRGDSSRDFDLLARWPSTVPVGQTRMSPTFRAMIAADPRGGSYEAASGGDNIRRSFSFQAVGSFPLITMLGLAPQDYLSDWWREVIKQSLLAAVFAVMTTLSGLSTWRSWQSLTRKTEELTRSNADLERFAYVSSHDLQTPLRTVALYTQLLERRYRGQMDAEADQFITFIVDAAKHMSRLIADLLTYSRVSDRSHPLLAVPTGPVMDKVLADLKPFIDDCAAEICVGALPVVQADETQLASLFQNLIGNAIKYRHPERQPHITVSAERQGPSLWRFAVADNGIGIDEHYFGKIFEIFQRLNPIHGPGGTGIGLAICRQIVWHCGGTIWVESKKGEGSTFFFTMSAAK